MLLFILGRQPEIGFAELRAVFGREVKLVSRDVAAIDFDKKNAASELSRLGSVVKVAEVFTTISSLNSDTLAKVTQENFANVEGKITLGVSLYGERFTVRETAKAASELKKVLSRNNSVRLVPNDSSALSSATVSHNKLAGDNPKKRELIFAKSDTGEIFVANTIFVQNIESYTFRDRSRPRRDARVGMLPPKLAQIIINLARGATKNSAETPVLLDPFCGTGVILQEAALMNMRVYGTDIEPRMIEYSRTNLDWLAQKYHREVLAKTEVGDATNYQWQQPIDLVATETYLGRAYTTEPNEDNLHENIANCNVILTKFLQNLAPQISRNTGLCIAVPCWFANGRTHHMPLIAKLAEISYEQIFYSDTHESLVYHREDQIVGRELLVLRKKS